MKQAFGIICFVVVLGVLSVNAPLMFISPRAWFRLPTWIRLSGSLSEAKYSAGWGAVQVRILGAVLLATILYFRHGLILTG